MKIEYIIPGQILIIVMLFLNFQLILEVHGVLLKI